MTDLRNEAALAIGRLEAEIADLPEGDPKVDDLQSKIESFREFLANLGASPTEALASIETKLKQMKADQKARKKSKPKSQKVDGPPLWEPTAKELKR